MNLVQEHKNTLMKKVGQPAVQQMRVKYLLIFVILGLLMIINGALFSYQIQRSQHDAALINISGRQRMLLEKTALLVENLVNENRDNKHANYRKELQDVIQLMKVSHQGLTKGNPEMELPGITSPTVKELYFDTFPPLDTQVRNYINAIEKLSQDSNQNLRIDHPSLEYIRTTIVEQKLLKSFNQVVLQYQRESKSNIYQLKWLEGSMLAVMLLVLFLGARFVVRPIVQQVQDDMEQLVIAEQELHIHQHRLEEKVNTRTKELQASQERFSGILDIAEDAIISIDNHHLIVLFNQGAEKIFGYTAKEVLGKSLNFLIPNRFHEAHHQHVQNFRNSGKNTRRMGDRQEIMGLRKDGTEFYAEASISQLDLEGEKLSTVMLRDITQQVGIEEELRIAIERAEATNLAKTQFLANMSHEIRTPLNSIVGFSQILLNRSQDLALPQEFKEFLENIKLSGQNLSELINNILDLSKIEAGKMTLSQEALNLKLLIQGVFHISKAQAINKGVHFNYDYDSQLPDMIYSDRTKLNQILINLVGNAIKFTPADNSVRLKVSRADKWVVLQVIDQGVGIPKSYQQVIFEPFKQVDATITRYFEGTGLGLAITKQMVNLLGGNIEVESTPGKGSTFSVRIPLLEAQSAAELETIDIHKVHFSKDNRVLVVEDNPTNQAMMKALFDDLGLDVLFATDGQAGITKTLEFHPDLILMDIHMPGIDGLAATRQIRMQPTCEQIPIVALSADAFTEQQEEAFEAGIFDYLTKPLDFDKLLPILLKYLQRETPKEIIAESPDLPPLPKDIEQKIQSQHEELSKIPLYMSDEIIDRVHHMLQLCKNYESPYINILKQIEDAVFSRNSKQIPDLIEKMLK